MKSLGRNSDVGIVRFWMALGIAVMVGGAIALAVEESFPSLVSRLQQEKPTFAKRQQDLLTERYDLSNRPAAGVTMSAGSRCRKRCA